MDNSKVLKISNYIAIIFDGIVLAIITVYKAKYGLAIIESDSASDIYYAHLLAEEKTLFSTNWFFSTELRILDNELIFALLFTIFPKLSWWSIEVLGTTIMNLLMGLSAVFCASSLRIKNKWWLFGLMILPYGFSEVYYVLLHGAGYYNWAIIEVLVLFGIYARLHDKSDKHHKLYAILFCVLSVYVGVSGIRLIEAFYMPMLLANFLVIDREAWKNLTIKNARDILFAARYAVLGLVCALIGYVIDVLIIGKIFPHATSGEFVWKKFSFDPIMEFINELFSDVGYNAGASVFSLRGMASACSCVVITLVGYCLFDWIRKDKSIIPYYLLSALSIHLIAYIFIVDYYRARYLLPFLCIVPIFMLKYFESISNKNIKYICVCIATVCITITSYCSLNDVTTNHQGIENHQLAEVADELVARDYVYGISTFWMANVTNQLTSGKLEVCAVTDIYNGNHYEWLSKKDSYKDDYDKKVFWLMDNDQYSEIVSMNPKVSVIYENEAFHALGFSSMAELKVFRKSLTGV